MAVEQPDPWIVGHHIGDQHLQQRSYGQLTVYYRAAGIVPPGSRPATWLQGFEEGKSGSLGMNHGTLVGGT